MSFWKRYKQAGRDADEALAAKIQAELDLKEAKKIQRQVAAQSELVREINRQNHFSESMTTAFRRKPA